jgi:hypothetical protein
MRLLPILLALLVTGCPKSYEPKVAPVPKDTDWCLGAEQNLELMKCKDRAGDPMWVNKKGERFEDTCKTAQEKGRIFLNPRCIAEAMSCENANQCPAEGM